MPLWDQGKFEVGGCQYQDQLIHVPEGGDLSTRLLMGLAYVAMISRRLSCCPFLEPVLGKARFGCFPLFYPAWTTTGRRVPAGGESATLRERQGSSSLAGSQH